jgi:multidrug efflux pump subunit AcrA (membrane-fusion protein)
MDLPYELRTYLNQQNTVQLELPDREQLAGSIASIMPSVDPASQTERVVIKVNSPHQIPENLIAKVRIIKSQRSNVTTVPKSSILTDEGQSTFWIMKLINDSTAVRLPVKKGIEQNGEVEIDAPLTDADRVLVTGNYGLEDSARVIVIRRQ